MSSPRVWRIGHRGAPTTEVENTLASFERALDEGANGIELDVCVTKDDQVVVWHDWSPRDPRAVARRLGWEPAVAFRPVWPARTLFRRSIRDLYADDVLRRLGYAPKRGPRVRIASAPVITFDEAFAFAAREDRLELLFVDVKIRPRAVDAVEPLLARLDALHAEHRPRFRVVLETSHVEVLDAMKRLRPRYDYALDVGPLLGLRPSAERYSAMMQALLHRNAWATAERPRKCVFRPFKTYRRIALHDVRLRRERCGDAARTPQLVGFTVNDRDEMRDLLRLGFDGLLTDVPHVLRDVVDEIGLGEIGARERAGAIGAGERAGAIGAGERAGDAAAWPLASSA